MKTQYPWPPPGLEWLDEHYVPEWQRQIITSKWLERVAQSDRLPDLPEFPQ